MTKGEVGDLKDAVIAREPDEDIFLGHVEKDAVRFETVEMDPRGRFENYIHIIDMGIMEGLQVPLLRYLRNATEASATKMLEVVERNVLGVQRQIKRVVERQFLDILIKRASISTIPTLNWGAPKTGLEDISLDGIASLKTAGAIYRIRLKNC